NVPGLLSTDAGRFFGTILRDLAASGYDAEWDCVPAAAFGAPHRRDRVWIVAYPDEQRRDGHDRISSSQKSQTANESRDDACAKGSMGHAASLAHSAISGMESQQLPAERRECLVDADWRGATLADAD